MSKRDTTVVKSQTDVVVDDLTQGSVLFKGATDISEDNDNLFWDETNKTLQVGETPTEKTITVNATEYKSHLKVNEFEDGNLAMLQLHRHSAVDAFGTTILCTRSNSAGTGHGVVTDGQNLLKLIGAGWTDDDYDIAAGIFMSVDGTPGADDMPGSISFLTTPSGSNVLVERVFIGEDGKILISELTASMPVWTDASKNLVSKNINHCDIVSTHIVATTQTVTTGTLSAGSVSDVQTWGDGNTVNVSEVTGVPGFDVRYTFASIADFCAFGISAYYTGNLASHYAEIQIYDDTNTTWRTLWTFSGGQGFNYRYSDFPDRANIANYINGSNQVIIRFYHPTTGNASHDLWVDYVSLIGVST